MAKASEWYDKGITEHMPNKKEGTTGPAQEPIQ